MSRESPNSEGARFKWHARLETDRELFARVCFPDFCGRPFNRMHLERFELPKVPVSRDRRSTKRATAAPRGNAKSTITGFVDLLHDIVYGYERFLVIISDTAALSSERVSDIKTELETNDFLRWVYGDLAPKKGGTWTQTDLVTANGVRVLASSMLKSIRGKKMGPWRPTKVVLDDAEDSDNVRSPMQRAKAESFLAKDILKAGASYTVFELIGTVLHPDALLAKAIKGTRGVGGWTPHFYQAIEAWPTNMGLWEQFGAIALDITRPTHDADARAFYEANREAMDQGAKILWPEHEPLVELMLMYYYDGEAAFNSEKQNDPFDPSTQIWDFDKAGTFELVPGASGETWVVCEDGFKVDLRDLEIVGFLDPSMAKQQGSDTAAFVTVGVLRRGEGFPLFFVLDVWVDRKPPSAQVEAIYASFEKWRHSKIGLEVNGFQALLKPLFERAAMERLQASKATPGAPAKAHKLPLYGITQHENKTARISTLEPRITHRWLRFRKDLPAEYRAQMRDFPTHAHDDAPDATEGACAVGGARPIKLEAIEISLFG